MIPIMIFEIEIENNSNINFGKNPGSSIRGSLYEALSLLYDTGYEAKSFTDDTNPVSWLMRMSDPNFKGGENLPRPFGIRPPLPKQPKTFGITLYGSACRYSVHLLSALDAMQTVGLGVRKQKFHIKKLYQIHPITNLRKLIMQSRRFIDTFDQSPESEQYFQAARAFNAHEIWIEFLTPTRIIDKNSLSISPIFSHWFGRLLSRIRRLSELYTSQPVEVPFVELKIMSEKIKLEVDNTQWQDTWSHSNRHRCMRPTSGYTGQVCYSGELGMLMPYLILGQSIQAGKNISKGNGYYRILQVP